MSRGSSGQFPPPPVCAPAAVNNVSAARVSRPSVSVSTRHRARDIWRARMHIAKSTIRGKISIHSATHAQCFHKPRGSRGQAARLCSMTYSSTYLRSVRTSHLLAMLLLPAALDTTVGTSPKIATKFDRLVSRYRADVLLQASTPCRHEMSQNPYRSCYLSSMFTLEHACAASTRNYWLSMC